MDKTTQQQGLGKDLIESVRANTIEIFKAPVLSSALDADEFMSSAPLTDTGNAECFQNEFGNDYRYNVSNKQWLRWNDVIWSEDNSGNIDSDILAVIRGRQRVTVSLDFVGIQSRT